MYLCGFSLDNLSLMALTISVGFVVDDAIVVVENIYRHVENGASPLQAALKGAREIGFTVVSISLSLVAVFIPLLLMGGIVGRLFREFAITVTIAIAVSAFVSLTLTPMLCSRFLKPESHRHGRLYRAIEWVFDSADRCLPPLARRGAASPARSRCWSSSRRWRRPIALFVVIPKGFFPIQDNGLIVGAVGSARRTCRRSEMQRLQQALAAVIARDPDVAAFGSVIGAGGAPDAQYRALLHCAEAARRAQGHRLAGHRPVAAAARQGRGRRAVPAAGAGHHRRRADLARPVPIHAAGREPRRAERPGRRACSTSSRRCRSSPTCRATSRRMRRS